MDKTKIKKDSIKKSKVSRQKQLKRSSQSAGKTLNKRKKSVQQTIARSPKKHPKKRADWIEQLLFLFFVCCCLYFLIRFQSHEVDGSSMLPTLQSGDRLLIHKGQAIQRYDIITFEPSDEPGGSYVKRVYGIPGDDILVNENRLYLFRKGVNHNTIEQPSEIEQLPDSTTIIWLSDAASKGMADLNQIPDGYYFVLGDNRANSKDSRSIGLIEQKQIEGVVHLRFYPLDRFGLIH